MIEQRTLDWFRDRLGMFTGSRIADLMTKGRGKDDVFSKTAMAYIYEVAYERMLDDNVVGDDTQFGYYLDETNVTSKAMRWGTENEPLARQRYEEATLEVVRETGSVHHPNHVTFSASPDGLVGTDGCLEIKCVGKTNWVRYLGIKDGDTLKIIEPRYYWQVQAEMACTGREWCDFVCYNPFVKEPLHIARIARNDADIDTMTERVVLAEEIIQRTILNT